MWTDQQCIRAVLAGQSEAYADLVKRYQGWVLGVCRKLTGDETAAEDLAQDTFLRAYRALATYREESSFSTWLYQIAVRQCLDWRRRQQREAVRQSAWQQEAVINGGHGYVWTDATPEATVVAREGRAEVRRLARSLREPYRTVVDLFYFQQRSCEDIAAATGATVKTVESQLYRARRLLRQQGGVGP